MMATFRELTTTGKPTRYQAQVRRTGHILSRVFFKEGDATKWAAKVEAAISIHSPMHPFNREDWLPVTAAKKALTKRMLGDALDAPNPGWTMAKALDRYLEEVGEKKASPAQERTRTKLLKASIGTIAMARLKLADVQAHVEARKKAGKGPATIRLEVMHLRAVWRCASAPKPHGWALTFTGPHPCKGVVLDPLPSHRERRLNDEDQQSGQVAEEAAIRAQILLLDIPDRQEVVDMWELGLLTGMRRAEMLNLHRDEVRKVGNIWQVTKFRHKTMRRGHIRRVILCPASVDIVQRRMADAGEDGRLFTIRVDRFRHYFRKAVRLAKVKNFRFHDVRHEGLSRMMDRGLTMGELKAQSGHQSAEMLMRYAHGKTKNIAAKLA